MPVASLDWLRDCWPSCSALFIASSDSHIVLAAPSPFSRSTTQVAPRYPGTLLMAGMILFLRNAIPSSSLAGSDLKAVTRRYMADLLAQHAQRLREHLTPVRPC